MNITTKESSLNNLLISIKKQANITVDPLFGDIQDQRLTKEKQLPPKNKQFPARSANYKSFSAPSHKSSFVTVAGTPERVECSDYSTYPSPSVKMCLFCKGEHNTETCKELNMKMYTEKVDFFKKNGVCFGCVTKGHMSKNCKKRMTCKTCQKKHPTILHVNRTEEKENENTRQEKTSISNALVSMERSIHTGAGDRQKLAIVPVQIKLENSNHRLKTYAFLDPGSTGSFCTETLRKMLLVKTTPSRILLRTLGQEKVIDINMVSGLEVSRIERDDFIKLPHVYIQEKIPVTREQIPNQDDIKEWRYLKEVKLPYIDADIGLLIGNDIPQLMEPWNVINSQGTGPYAVDTRIGWVVNGLLHERCGHKGS